MPNLGTAEGRIVIDGSGAARGFGVAGEAATAFGQVVQEKLSKLDEIGTKLQRVGIVGGGAFGAAITAAAGFESQLSAVAAVTGETEGNMDKLRAAALRIGKDTTFSATEAASAIEELAKAGISTSDILNGAADATVALAAAGGVSLPEAAELAANALNVFNLKGTDMAGVADTIAGAANASAISVSEFRQSLSQSGAVANLAGLDFNDLAVAIAEMGNAGIKGSDAGTSIKTFLQNLIPTTSAQINAFEDLGLVAVGSGEAMKKLADRGIKPVSGAYNDVKAAISKYVEESGGAKRGTAANNKETQKLGSELGALNNRFYDAKGNLKSFAEVQQILQDATKGLTAEQKQQTLETLFGSDALRAAAVFAKEGSAGFNELAGAMSKVTAQQVAAKRLDNFKGALEQLKGSLETAAITIGSVFLPMVTRIVKFLGSVIDIFNNLPPGVQKAITIFLAIGAVLAGLVGTLLTLIVPITLLLTKFLGFAALKSIFSIFGTFFKVLRGGAGAAEVVAATIGRAGVVFGRFGAIGKIIIGILPKIFSGFMVLRGIGGIVFGPIGLAVSLALTALQLLYQYFPPFRNLVNAVGSAIKSGFLAALNGVHTAVGLISAGFNGAKGSFSSFGGVLKTIGGVLRFVWDQLKAVGAIFRDTVLPAFKEAGGQILSTLKESFGQVAEIFRSQVGPAFAQLGQALAPLLPYLQQFGLLLLKVVGVLLLIGPAILVGVVLGLTKMVALFAQYVLPVLIQFVAFVLGNVIGAIAGIASVVAIVIAKIASVLAAVVNFFTGAKQAADQGKSGISTALSAIGGFFVGLGTTIVNALKTAFTAVIGFFTTIGTAIGTAVQTAFSFVVGIVTTVMETVKGVVQAGLAVLLSIWSAFWGSPLGGLVSAILDLVVSLIILFYASVRALFLTATAAISATWSAFWNKTKEVASTVLSAIKTAVSTGFNAVKTVVTTVMNAVSAFITSVWTKIKTTVTTAVSSVKSTITTGFNAVSTYVTSIWNKIKTTVTTAANAVKTKITEVWTAIKTATNSAWNTIYSYIKGPLDKAKASVTSVTSSIKSTVNAAWNTVKTYTSSAWESFRSTISSKVDAALTIVKGIKGRVTSALSGASSWLFNAGANIVRGLINGINSLIGTVTTKITALAGKVKTAAAAALKINSPSKVFRDEIGKSVPEGWAVGIDKNAFMVLDSVKALAKDMISPALSSDLTGLYNNARPSTTVAQPVAPTGPTVHQEVKIYNPETVRDSKDVDRVLQLAGAFLP